MKRIFRLVFQSKPLAFKFNSFYVKEWELQFSEKYNFVGKLIKPGEEPTFYSDASSEDEDEDKKTQ